MSQVSSRAVNGLRLVRTKAFRTGYNEVAKGKPLDTTRDWGTWRVAYEMGRLAAAFALGRGDVLRAIPVNSRVSDEDLYWLYGLSYEVSRIREAVA